MDQIRLETYEQGTGKLLKVEYIEAPEAVKTQMQALLDVLQEKAYLLASEVEAILTNMS
jgi:hypothetical protein